MVSNPLTNEGIDEAAGHLPVLLDEERELLIVGQLHGQAQVGQADVGDRDDLGVVGAEAIGQRRTQRSVFVRLE